MKNAFSKINIFGGKANTKPGYTPPDKKGEINELKTALSDPSIDKDQQKKREVLQKVIGFTTMGLDTSKLFDKMILCVHTRDIVQKKMVYQYVTHFSHANPELAIMTINTLSKDCRDENPIIRGLALRSLSSLRVPKIAEHLYPLINEGLNDPSPYVRKTAVTSVCKLNRISPQTVQSEKLVDRLYAMIRDKDTQVVINCIDALNEILDSEGGMKVTKIMVYYLLNRISEYNEWQLCKILDVLMRYAPAQQNEVFDIMNLLDDKLNSQNAAVVMAVSNVFLYLTSNLPKVHLKVYGRVKDALLLLLAVAPHELAYSILQHIKLMITRAAPIFAPHFKDFFIRHNDPSYLKALKLETLVLVATEQNVVEIMEELSFYVSIGDNDAETAKAAIRALGEIAVRLSGATEASLTYLLDFLDMEVPHVITETFVVLKDILRKYNNEDFCSTYLPNITKHWKTLEDPESHVAFIWVLGEFGEIVESAPYILEHFIENFKSYHHTVRLEILTSAMKLFFKRPPEVQLMLGKLFDTSISDTSHADVHDRALFYYRLLQNNVVLARQVINSPKNLISSFTEEESSEYRDRLFSEFNTLSVSFGKPQERFIVTGPGILGANEEEEEVEEVEEVEEEEEEEEELENQEQQMKQRLLEDPEGELLSLGTSQQQQPQPVQSQPRLPLNATPKTLAPNVYQEKWQRSGVSKTFALQLRVKPNPQEVEKSFKANRVPCIAFNVNTEPVMFYFYAQREQTDEYFLMETKLFANNQITFLVKNDKNNTQEIDLFMEFIKTNLRQYL